ncbi:[Fe-Fe] hydrogenase large subunit C-terminal domain-containing protein [Anaeromicropila herbilytica]|uniref:Iron hydrogenase n=1 Tax=Anaeromicropila herbilytica TaxID=2785025 RepID=A0A7R7EL91_9FIRM|nr:[Fe-Fe] hydrogenase large subunit C-terminal domain-containing protein [Anaeromicropila herbilytica]BCN30676.1 iron hydrogenase [Anaeromicropila herbilytica]
MKTFKELYDYVLESAINNDFDRIKQIEGEFEPDHLDCLLHPHKHPLILNTGKCSCSTEDQTECIKKCPFDAMKIDPEVGVIIDQELCVGCSECIHGCGSEKLRATTDIIPTLKAIRSSKGLVYALIAPAFLGQFSEDVTPGKLRNALKEVGFDGMIEVALFADILTLKEALEFDKKILKESDYQLTSCCCPMWIGMIRKKYHELMPHVPGSVSPMVASGRAIKILHPDALTVFIGPCMAKKAEAREKDIADAVDYVLTFQEVQNIFDALGIDPSKMEDSEKDHSSRAGRIYARAGGVSEAVEKTLTRINPHRKITIKTKRADGVPACRAMMNEILEETTDANFFEGMGCRGGCVGGPKAVIPVEEATKKVDIYGDDSPYPTPIENPYVIELLNRLGFDTIESLLENTDIFTRNFE